MTPGEPDLWASLGTHLLGEIREMIRESAPTKTHRYQCAPKP